MRRTFLFVFTLITTAGVARAQLTKQTVPGKWLDPFVPEDLPKLDYPGYANALDKAQMESFAGRYKRSLMTLLDVPADADAVRVTLVKGRSLSALGRFDEAIEALSQKTVVDDPRVIVLRATVLSDFGRNDEAIALLKDQKAIAARFTLAHCYERTGDLKNALATYSWFADGDDAPFARYQQQQERAFESAEDVVYIGRAADRWAAMTSAYKDHPELHNAILNTFVRAYDVIDRRYSPAHVAGAEYYLSHDNDEEAQNELKAALAGNPQDAASIALLGRIALEHFDFDKCDRAVAALRAIDAKSVTADLLEARNLLAQRSPSEAIKPLERALAARPKSIEAMGLLAATYALQLKDEKTAEILKKVDELDVDHDDATAYLEVADQLGAMRQYPRSAAMYKVAIDRAGWWTEPRNGLGLLYTQSGDEDLAQATLDSAHTLDPFNLRTTNYLRLLEDLNKFARKETDHFIVMYDAKEDPVIPEYFGEYLESIHAQVSSDYRAEPRVKTMIEVFPSHDAFSVRTTGSPWIGTVGASTGRVIALVSPRKGEMTMGPFNWAQVLRHEYTHTVTLAATDNRISHWMTEGLAVYQEHSPLRWDWVPMLYRAVTKDELFTLDNLTWGFIRPRKPTDRQLAYAQSFWICQYLEEKYGHDSVLKMLDLFKQGQQQEEVFPKVTGRSTTEFDEDFKRWAQAQVSTWGYDDETSKKYDELRERGQDLIKQKKYADAVKVWEQIVAIRPVDALPHTRLAGLYLTKEVNDKEKAIAHLKVLHEVELKNNQYTKRIAGIYRGMGKLKDATDAAVQAVYIDPYDLAAHKLLAELAEKSGDVKTLERERRVVEILEKRESSDAKPSRED